MSDTPRARVFISCGQGSGEEREVAERVTSIVTGLGFDPYVAVREQSLKGIRENIFWRLKRSEYFIFIDFAREQLANRTEHRGSLFSHQELAIASYLDLDAVVLQEEGILTRDGLVGYLQANAQTFTARDDVPNIVKAKVESAGWRSGWRNELSLEMHDPPYTDTYDLNNPTLLRRFFHLKVRNRHDREAALNCVATVETISRGPRTNSELRRAELCWAGTSVPQVLIPPGGAREVDLGFVPHADPGRFFFNSFTTSPQQYLPPLQGLGEHLVTYLIASATFPPVRFKARVTLGEVGKPIDDVWVEEAA